MSHQQYKRGIFDIINEKIVQDMHEAQDAYFESLFPSRGMIMQLIVISDRPAGSETSPQQVLGMTGDRSIVSFKSCDALQWLTKTVDSKTVMVAEVMSCLINASLDDDGFESRGVRVQKSASAHE